jgi:hypothetical protein
LPGDENARWRRAPAGKLLLAPGYYSRATVLLGRGESGKLIHGSIFGVSKTQVEGVINVLGVPVSPCLFVDWRDYAV